MVKFICYIVLLYYLKYNYLSNIFISPNSVIKNKFYLNNNNKFNKNYNIRFYSNNSNNEEYIKLKIENPFENRKQISYFAKNKKGVYIFEILNKNIYYIGSSINLYSRVCSYFMPSILSKADRYVLRYFRKNGFKNVNLILYIMKDSSTIKEILTLEEFYIKKYSNNKLLNIEIVPRSGYHLPALRYGKMLLWVKLSNSGNTLKLLMPNYSWKAISGWSNYSCKEIIQKIDENQMGYRGSKSKFYINFVKEQRVDGSWWIKLNHLRCTLVGFERNNQIKIPSKQLKRNFSTLKKNSKLNPWFLTGLIDAEGSFIISIKINKELKLGWRVRSIFSICLHSRDLSLLLELQEYFGGIGSISKNKNRKEVIYSVNGLKDLTTVLIPHFEKYGLLTQKAADFILFTKVVELMNTKAHLSLEGLKQIINIKASMNLGLSETLKSEFNNIISVDRPIILTKNIPNPNWLSGFVTGEGNFYVNIQKSKSNLGSKINLRFQISQHERDLKLIDLLIKYLGSGKIYKGSKNRVVSLTIYKFSDIINLIIPFFEQNPLYGVKVLDFIDWCSVAKLMSEGKHLTIEGLELISTIKDRMNRGRKITKN